MSHLMIWAIDERERKRRKKQKARMKGILRKFDEIKPRRRPTRKRAGYF